MGFWQKLFGKKKTGLGEDDGQAQYFKEDFQPVKKAAARTEKPTAAKIEKKSEPKVEKKAEPKVEAPKAPKEPKVYAPAEPGSVEEKIEEICELLEEHEEASLFFLLKDADSRAELVARFMGVLELIKIQRIKITSIKVIEDVIEYEENGLEMMFALNPDYVPGEATESVFDTPVTEENEENG